MFKPMLSGKLTDPQALSYPVLASPKLDGIRCLILNGVAVSRNLKAIPNKVVSDMLRGLPPMDGELIVGPVNGSDVYNRTSSGIMSREGAPEFTFWVFDVLTGQRVMPFNQRLELVRSYTNSCGQWVQPVPHTLIKSAEMLADYEAKQVEQGFEGAMVRSLDGPYKHGRSTEREGYLLKIKRFEDSEAEVLGTVEKMHNANEQTRDELGRAKRSSHKAGKVGTGLMGALCVRDVHTGVEFEVGAGFSDEQRAQPWHRGTIIKYKFQPAGVKDKPRFPVFLGIRDAADT